MRYGFERYHDDIVLFSRTSIKTGYDRLKMSLNSLLRLPSTDSSVILVTCLIRGGEGYMLSLVRLGYKNSCSFLLGLLEHLFMLLSFCAVKKPKKPCGEVHMERNRGLPTDSQQNSQLTASTILPDGNEPS